MVLCDTVGLPIMMPGTSAIRLGHCCLTLLGCRIHRSYLNTGNRSGVEQNQPRVQGAPLRSEVWPKLRERLVRAE